MSLQLNRILGLSLLSRTINGFIFILLAVYLLSLGFNGIQIGILLALLSFMSLFVGVPTGIINDRFDIRYTILLGYICMATFLFSIAVFNDFLLFIVFFAIGGIGMYTIETSFRDFIFKDREPRHEGKKFGKFNLAEAIGFSIGALFGGIIAYLVDFQTTLVYFALFFLLLSPLLLLIKPEKVTRTRLVQYKRDFFRKKNILIITIVFLMATHWGAEVTSYGPFLETVLGLDASGIGLFYSVSILFLGIAAFYAGKRIDRGADFKKLFIIGLLISGAAHILMTYPDYYTSLIFRSVHEAGDGITIIALFYWIGMKFQRAHIGGDSQLVFLVMTLGNIMGSLIYGPIGFALGYSVPLAISGVVLILAAVVFLIFRRVLGDENI